MQINFYFAKFHLSNEKNKALIAGGDLDGAGVNKLMRIDKFAAERNYIFFQPAKSYVLQMMD